MIQPCNEAQRPHGLFHQFAYAIWLLNSVNLISKFIEELPGHNENVSEILWCNWRIETLPYSASQHFLWSIDELFY